MLGKRIFKGSDEAACSSLKQIESINSVTQVSTSGLKETCRLSDWDSKTDIFSDPMNPFACNAGWGGEFYALCLKNHDSLQELSVRIKQKRM